MNYIKEAENYLNHYRDLNISINNMKKQLDKTIRTSGPHEVSGISINESGVRAETVQDDALNTLFKIKTLQESISETQKKIDEINEIFINFSSEPVYETYAEVLRMWYIDKVPKSEILEKIGYSDRQFWRIKDEAIRKFAINIFGLHAFKSVG